jgi:hypothetical protein
MEIFELHFNPRAREDLIFDSFCYEPANIYEKRLGSLYVIGELRNALPENYHFLSNLAQVIKGNFYFSPIKPREKSFKDCLKKANEFLEKEVEKNNTSWLGNLNLAVISLKNFNLNFTKVGDIKILLLRSGQIIDIGKELEFQEFEPYPLKIFSNIVTGKLAPNDIILIATKEIFSAFNEKEGALAQNLLEKIATQVPFEEKLLKKILKENEKFLSQISGVCVLVVLKPKILSKQAFKFEAKIPLFSFRKIFLPLKEGVQKISIFFKKFSFLPKVKITAPIEKITKLPKFFSVFKKIKIFLQLTKKELIETFGVIKETVTSQSFKKKLILVLALVFFLLVGFSIFREKRDALFERAQKTFPEIQEKITMAENFLILKEEKKANSLLLQAWEEILPFIKEESPVKREAQLIKAHIEEKLFELNKLEEIRKPEILLEFTEKEILPQRMVSLDKTLYFFNPYFNGFLKFEEGKKVKIETGKKYKLATPFDQDSIVFFLPPDKLIFTQKDRLGPEISLKIPYPEFEASEISSFAKNIYLFDKKTGKIIKYKAPLVIGRNFPEYWLRKGEELKDAKSMAIDGSIWILTKENKINRYYTGKLQQSFTLEIFPIPKSIEKIFTNKNLPYLFILEPAQNRIIILDKTGKIVKQFQSKEFDNLKDLAVSGDKTIYVLNGKKVYQIKY